jgi:hypothetical protein
MRKLKKKLKTANQSAKGQKWPLTCEKLEKANNLLLQERISFIGADGRAHLGERRKFDIYWLLAHITT